MIWAYVRAVGKPGVLARDAIMVPPHIRFDTLLGYVDSRRAPQVHG
jgi:hypothetical protein